MGKETGWGRINLTGVMSHYFKNTCAPKQCPLLPPFPYKSVLISSFGVPQSPHTWKSRRAFCLLIAHSPHYCLPSKHHHGSYREGVGLQLDLQNGDDRNILKKRRSWCGHWRHIMGARWIIWLNGQMNWTMISPVFYVCCVYYTTIWYI